jgi:GAF domain-containing protein
MGENLPRPAIPASLVQLWQRIVDAAATLLKVPSVMINRLDPPDLEVFRSNATPSNPFPSGTRMPMLGIYCEAAAKRREMLVVHDARNDPEWADSPTAKAGIYAYLGFPICWPDGEVFGTLCAVDVKGNEWGESPQALLLAYKEAVEAHLALAMAMDELVKKNEELAQSLAEVKTLRGILPVCSSCKKIRDDRGYWNQVESYIREHTEAQISHSLCPDCARKLYPSLYGDMNRS